MRHQARALPNYRDRIDIPSTFYAISNSIHLFYDQFTPCLGSSQRPLKDKQS